MENSSHHNNRILGVFFLLLTMWVTTCRAATNNHQFVAIAYHDVVINREELASDAVTTDHLIDQFEWLLANGYHPVSIDDLIAAAKGVRPLPQKAVLLTWDDGYTSFYKLVFPLLRAYNFPAVLALVGSWLEPEPGATVLYGNNPVPRTRFLTWEQIRELDQSGLVEIASHSYSLHQAILADDAGDRLPAVIAHLYDPKTGRYESDKEHQQRIRTDLQKNSSLIKMHLGHPPRVMVWPFGRYNSSALHAAQETGMSITLTLDPVPGDISHLQEIGRIYPTLNPDLSEFRNYLDGKHAPPVRRFFKIQATDLLEDNANEQHFSAFLDRLVTVKPDMVAFEPILSKDGILQTLFPNDYLPLAQNRLIRLTWHTSRRGLTGTMLWLPESVFSKPVMKDQATGTNFFYQMGKQAFSGSLLIDYPALSGDLLETAITSSDIKESGLFWNPAKRRQARKNYTDDRSPLILHSFQQLEAFQYWQPFVEVGLLLPFDSLTNLDKNRTRYLLQFFDFLLLDGRPAETTSLSPSQNNRLQQLKDAGFLPKVSILLQNAGKEQKLIKKLSDLPRNNLINWGYEYDDFLNGKPSSQLIRPFISRSSFPYK